jgi:peptidoglycan/LPS O-acetylase OafA/YrhL
MPAATRSDRSRPEPIEGLHLVRAAAALAVVLLHACVPYLRHPMPGLIWMVRDQPSELADWLFWGTEVFVMPLFLVLSGFLLCRSAGRSQPGRIIRSRARRLLIPLAFGVLVVLPIDLYLWTLGLVAEGEVPSVKLRSFKFDPPVSEQIWGLSHLWYLQYVFLYSCVFAACLWCRDANGLKFESWKHRVGRVGGQGLTGLILIATALATLWLAPEVVWGFQHSFLPVPTKWLYSGVFFAAGCLLAVSDPRLERLASHSSRTSGVAVVLLFAAVVLGRWYLKMQVNGGGDFASAKAALAALTLLAAGSFTAGAIGVAVRWCSKCPRSVKWLASASFWIYLVHHPVVGLVQLDMKWLFPSLASELKVLSVFAISLALCLLTYEFVLVRTPLAGILGMSKRSPKSPGEAGSIPTRETHVNSNSHSLPNAGEHRRAA